MDLEIENEYLKGLFEGDTVKGKPKFQKELIQKFIKTVNILRGIPRLETMFQMKSLNYKKLEGTNGCLSSVRVNKQYRLEFKEVVDATGNVIKFIITDLSNHYE